MIASRRYTTYSVVYCLPAIAAVLFYWIRMKVVQQLTCLTYRLNGPAYSTGELLNTPSPLVSSGAYHIDLLIGCLQ